MNGILILLLFLLITLLPALPLYFWFRARHFGVLPFLLALAAGVFTVLIAALAQIFFPPLPNEPQMGTLVFGVIRISLVEELSRLVVLFALFRFLPIARIPAPPALPGQEINSEPSKQAAFFGAPSGMAAGFGFAIAENIFYSLSNPEIILWRVFAIALHGACGARIGVALSMGWKQLPGALIYIITAVLIHAMYNFCLLNPGLPGILAAMLALTSLVSSLLTMSQASHNSR